MDSELASQLVDMAEAQFAAQVPLGALLERDPAFASWISGVGFPLTASWPAGDPPAELVHIWNLADEHDKRLKEIVDGLGWPGRRHVDEDGADAAWVIAQHADRHHEWRRTWLRLLREAVTNQDADPRHFARLADRVALVDDGLQLYGTWVQHTSTGQVVFDPPALGDATDVDVRRRDIGLPPLDVDLAAAP